MPETIGARALAAMLRQAADEVRKQRDRLSRLDAAIGDGDHGTTMAKIAGAMLAAVDGCPEGPPAALLEAVGLQVMAVDGGAAPPLLGSLFLGMSERAAGLTELSSGDLAAICEAGAAKLCRQTPAKAGDKTLLDALLPAVEALRAAAGDGVAPAAALARAAEAAARGAERTKALQARCGRARHLGARSIGVADPGATSRALLFADFRDGLGATPA